jgi:hypothetical protein
MLRGCAARSASSRSAGALILWLDALPSSRAATSGSVPGPSASNPVRGRLGGRRRLRCPFGSSSTGCAGRQQSSRVGNRAAATAAGDQPVRDRRSRPAGRPHSAPDGRPDPNGGSSDRRPLTPARAQPGWHPSFRAAPRRTLGRLPPAGRSGPVGISRNGYERDRLRRGQAAARAGGRGGTSPAHTP